MRLHNKFSLSCTRNFGPPLARYPFAKSRPITSETSRDLRIANCSVFFYANDKSNKGVARARPRAPPEESAGGGINRAAKSTSES